MREFEYEANDLAENRVFAALGYIVFFLPLIKCRSSELGKHTSSQGLLLAILAALMLVLGGILSVIPLIGWIFRLASLLIVFALLVIGIFCFVLLMGFDRAVELPFIGFIKLIR